MGKRVDWGVRENWEGNYLASTKENPEASTFQSALRNMRNKDGFREVSADGTTLNDDVNSERGDGEEWQEVVQ